MNVGVDQPRLHPQPGEADRKIGGDGGFADPALAACNGDEPPLATFGGTHDADVTNSRNTGSSLANPRFELADRVAGKPVHRSEEHTSELQSIMRISYAVFGLKKKKKQILTELTRDI